MMHGTESYEVICSNLAYALKMEDAAHALKQAQLAEMAVMMAKATEDKEDGDEQRRVWNEALSVLPESCDRVDLANRYYDALGAKPKNDLYFLDQDEVRSVSYLRNRGSDGAYDYFTSALAHVRAVYVSGHEDALENCYDEYADACILPYSDPERGMHTGFRLMIARYGLKINGMVRVENLEGTAMDFVLLRREVSLPTTPSYLALTLSAESGTDLVQPLLAAERFGLTKAEMTRLPESFSNLESYDLHFYGNVEDIHRYLFYLALNYPRCELLGVYRKDRETI